MTGNDQLDQLRRQRNCLAAAAVLLIAVSVGISLPRVLARQNRLKALDAELLGLQGSLLSVQQRTREVQAEIVRTQDEIRALLKQP